MRLLTGIVVLMTAFTLQAAVCVCQFPDTDSRHGRGVKGEIAFYKMGCSYWFNAQKDCRDREIKNIDHSMKEYLDKRVHSKELVRIGYVGHWGGSYSTIRFLDQEVKPLLDRYRVSMVYDNTACDPMNDPKMIHSHIRKYELREGTYLKVKGAQTTSIGLWDGLSRKFKYADLMAEADTRKLKATFPKCDVYLNKRCTKHQYKESGKCEKDGILKRIQCRKTDPNKKAKYWLYF